MEREAGHDGAGPALQSFDVLEFDLGAALSASMVTVVFTLFFIDFFDTAGTLTSVANVAGKIGRDGKIEDIDKAMLSDSVSTVAGVSVT